MTDYDTLSFITTIIGLVISAIMLGFHIGNKDKNNRHQFIPALLVTILSLLILERTPSIDRSLLSVC